MYGEQENEENSDSSDIEAVTLTELLDDIEESHVRLPPHHRCAAHTLNLVATHDAAGAERDTHYAKAARTALSKCSLLWNKQGQSAAAADAIKRHCGIYLVRPVATRWNSLYDSLECILRLKGEGIDFHPLLCTLGLPLFQPSDMAFIEEYCAVSLILLVALFHVCNLHNSWVHICSFV